MYCVYLTIYRGNKNKMPPFYIGSSSVEKVQNGYHGSVSSKKWKETWWSEIKDNPHLFESKIVTFHNTRQEAIDREYKFQKQLNVVTNPMYINLSYATKNGYFGKITFGKDHPNYGRIHKSRKSVKKTDDTKRKISIARNKREKRKWITNGVDNQLIPLVVTIPDNWYKGKTKKSGQYIESKPKSEIHKKKLSQAQTGKILSKETRMKMSLSRKKYNNLIS